MVIGQGQRKGKKRCSKRSRILSRSDISSCSVDKYALIGRIYIVSQISLKNSVGLNTSSYRNYTCRFVVSKVVRDVMWSTMLLW